ncbi:MAG TPA: hypothetical protein VFN37_08345 [Candidatus Baltobacteraceae bacterium]|nr:hypothetical protein [Candidatus Baltobacteraceae bacterium]
MKTIETTYGALKPGQAYRLPGNERWYHRVKNNRLTDEMCEQEVEALPVDQSPADTTAA